MKRIPRSAALKKLFIDRNRYRSILLGEKDAREGSRIDGAPPRHFVADPPKCPRCHKVMDYFLTIEGDLVGPDIAKGRALSIFACADVDCRLRNMGLSAEPPNVLAITHAPSPRATGKKGRRLVRNHLLPEKIGDHSDPRLRGSRIERSKLGGEVFYIQTSIAEDVEDAESRDLSFLMQIDEQDLGEHTTSLGFWGGVVYLFTQRDKATGLPTLENGRVTWSYT